MPNLHVEAAGYTGPALVALAEALHRDLDFATLEAREFTGFTHEGKRMMVVLDDRDGHTLFVTVKPLKKFTVQVERTIKLYADVEVEAVGVYEAEEIAEERLSQPQAWAVWKGGLTDHLASGEGHYLADATEKKESVQ